MSGKILPGDLPSIVSRTKARIAQRRAKGYRSVPMNCHELERVLEAADQAAIFRQIVRKPTNNATPAPRPRVKW